MSNNTHIEISKANKLMVNIRGRKQLKVARGHLWGEKGNREKGAGKLVFIINFSELFHFYKI